MSVTAAWVTSLLVALQPQAPWRDTYEKTADAIAKVSSSEPVYEGDHGDERTASLLVAIAWYESRFKPDAVSANKQYVCLFQLDKRHLAEPDKALVDQEMCARGATKILKTSLTTCAKNAPDDRLAIFMAGQCDKGLPESRYRSFLAQKLLKEHPSLQEDTGRGARVVAER